jgi:hypothetical protein
MPRWLVARISLSVRFLFVFLSAAGQAQERPASSIDPQNHRAEIRAALIKQTPLGSTIAEVQTFIVTKLLPKDAPPSALEVDRTTAGKSQKQGIKFIRVHLGEYLNNPGTIFLTAPLVTVKEVIAQWNFDEQDRLSDIVVEKKSAMY